MTLELQGRAFKFDAGYGQICVVDNEVDGPCVLFIHGNSACKEVFHEQFRSSLAQTYRLIAVDLPGCGASDNAKIPQDVYRMKPMAAIIANLLIELHVAEVVLMGWSLGGHLALELAVGLEGLKGVIITGTPPSGPGRGEASQAFNPTDEMALTAALTFTDKDVELYGEAIFGDIFGEDQVFRQAVSRADGQMRQTAIFDWGLNENAGHHQVDVVAELSVPIAVIDGSGDSFINRDWMKNLTWGNLWRGKFHNIEKAGHAPFLENPDAYNATLGEFLSDVF
jgi:pimeloyl-ACP methyl ester carboxylesterase